MLMVLLYLIFVMLAFMDLTFETNELIGYVSSFNIRLFFIMIINILSFVDS